MAPSNDENISDDNDEEAALPKKNETCPKLKTYRLLPQIMASIVVCWMSLLQGYATAYTSPADASMTKELKLTAMASSWISSCLAIGAIIGCVFGIVLIDRLGRKAALILANLFFLTGWTVNCVAGSSLEMYVSRSLIGIGVGITSLTLPVYLAEIVHHKIRGRLSLLSAILGNFGILLCFCLGNLLLQWKGLAFIACLLTLPFLAAIWLIPETPRWLLLKKKIQKAKNSLQWLRGKNFNIEEEFLVFSSKTRAIQREKVDYFTVVHIKAFMIVLGLMLFQQLTGINAVIFYATHIFEISGSDLNPSLCTAIVGVVNFISTFITTLFVDRLGRKVLLYISSTIIINALTILGVYFYLLHIQYANLHLFHWLPLVIFVFYILGFSLGFGPLPWLIMGEIFPNAIRGPAASLCAAFSWACSFIIIKTFPIVLASIGAHYTFWFFSVFTLFSIIFVRFFLPETKKKTLEEIEQTLLGSHHL